MTRLMPSCAEVTGLLTDYEEGALGPVGWARLKLHLAICPPCQRFLDGLDRTPDVLQRAWGQADTCRAERALAGALQALREGRLPRGPQLHPDPEDWQALEGGGDPHLAILLRVHLALCDACRASAPQAVPPMDPAGLKLPEALAPLLPPGYRPVWSRWGLGGTEFALVGRNPATGAALYLARLKPGGAAPPHLHRGAERSLVLRGRLQDGAAHLQPGDWIRHPPGGCHAPVADAGETCWSLIHLDQPIRFLGWRRIFNLR